MVGGWVFKNKFLRNLFIPQNNFKTILKGLLPSKKIRKMIKQKLMNISISEAPHLSAEMRDKLTDYYKQDILDLSILLNRNLSHWIKRH